MKIISLQLLIENISTFDTNFIFTLRGTLRLYLTSLVKNNNIS